MQSKKLKLLVIDDNPDNLITLKALIADTLPGIEAVTASNGKSGLELAQKENPDIILLDIVMPGMDGIEVCKRLKRDKYLELIPVIFLTVLKTSRKLRFQALAAGAEGFLSKPYDITELTAQIMSMAKIKAANVRAYEEKERLEALVLERTQELEQELVARRLIEQELRESEQKYRHLIENSHDIIYTLNPEGIITFVSPSCTTLLGYPEKKMLGKSFQEFVHPEDIAKCEKILQESIETRKRQGGIEFRIKHCDGSWRWHFTNAVPVFDEDGQVACCEGISSDITERKKREEEINYLNHHDILTGIYNRRFFEIEFERLDTKGQFPISVIMGDINGLKLINDAFGHVAGDNLLAETARILRRICSEKDVLARVGGDEFCILLPQSDYEAAQKIYQQINEAFEQNEKKRQGKLQYLSVAFGLAAKTDKSQSLSSVLKKAEDFMYKKKLLEKKSLHSNIISSIKTTLFEKSHETERHAERLVELSKLLGMELNLTEEQFNELELFATLHDIGKISIDDYILQKPDKLNEEEWEIMKKHPEIGYRIAMSSPELLHIAEYILCHHERWDGKGYPQGLAGEEIPLLSRILAVVDTYDAMTEDRPYRKGVSQELALKKIKKNAGTQFDPVVANIFIDIVINKKQE